jgi:hypothetical protein
VADTKVKAAVVPLNLTALLLLKFVPVMVTMVPTGPLLGVKPVIVVVAALKDKGKHTIRNAMNAHIFRS